MYMSVLSFAGRLIRAADHRLIVLGYRFVATGELIDEAVQAVRAGPGGLVQVHLFS